VVSTELRALDEEDRSLPAQAGAGGQDRRGAGTDGRHDLAGVDALEVTSSVDLDSDRRKVERVASTLVRHPLEAPTGRRRR
jgi:hypothetical protein